MLEKIGNKVTEKSIDFPELWEQKSHQSGNHRDFWLIPTARKEGRLSQ